MAGMQLSRAPAPCLRPFVRSIWLSAPEAGPLVRPAREHVVPTGGMHLVFRLSGPALRLFRHDTDAQGFTVGHAIVGGARSAFHVRDVSVPTRSVGAMLQPGAALALFGAPEDALAERHTSLDALWGAAAALALERLHAAATPAVQLQRFEQLLAERLSLCVSGLHPALAQALSQLEGGAVNIRELVRQSGYSHRHFISLFRGATGLAPKQMGRVLRLRNALARLAAEPRMPWAGLAHEANYSDQSHFHREFLGIVGVTPEAYRRAAPLAPHHVPLA